VQYSKYTAKTNKEIDRKSLPCAFFKFLYRAMPGCTDYSHIQLAVARVFRFFSLGRIRHAAACLQVYI